MQEQCEFKEAAQGRDIEVLTSMIRAIVNRRDPDISTAELFDNMQELVERRKAEFEESRLKG